MHVINSFLFLFRIKTQTEKKTCFQVIKVIPEVVLKPWLSVHIFLRKGQFEEDVTMLWTLKKHWDILID